MTLITPRPWVGGCSLSEERCIHSEHFHSDCRTRIRICARHFLSLHLTPSPLLPSPPRSLSTSLEAQCSGLSGMGSPPTRERSLALAISRSRRGSTQQSRSSPSPVGWLFHRPSTSTGMPPLRSTFHRCGVRMGGGGRGARQDSISTRCSSRPRCWHPTSSSPLSPPPSSSGRGGGGGPEGGGICSLCFGSCNVLCRLHKR